MLELSFENISSIFAVKLSSVFVNFSSIESASDSSPEDPSKPSSQSCQREKKREHLGSVNKIRYVLSIRNGNF